MTPEILALLKKHREKFLELLEILNKTAKEGIEARRRTKKESEINLVERLQELEEFQAIKVKVNSFICMCDSIQPGET